MTNGKAAVPNGRAAMTNGKAAIPKGRAAVTNGKAAIPNGRAAMTKGRVAMPNGKAAMTKGRRQTDDIRLPVYNDGWPVPKSFGRMLIRFLHALEERELQLARHEKMHRERALLLGRLLVEHLQ